MVRLKLMPPLTRLVGAKEVVVDVGRAPLKTVLEQAAAANAKFKAAILDERGRLSSEYSCLVNGRRSNVSGLDGVEVDENDEIVLLMPIAGGILLRGGRGAGGPGAQHRAGRPAEKRRV